MLGNDIFDTAADLMQTGPEIQTAATDNLDDASRQISTPILANDASSDEIERYMMICYCTQLGFSHFPVSEQRLPITRT